MCRVYKSEGKEELASFTASMATQTTVGWRAYEQRCTNPEGTGRSSQPQIFKFGR